MNRMDVTTIPQDPGQRRAWVLYQLRLRGWTLAALARQHGLSRNAPGLAFRRPYPRMEQLIAQTLGVSPVVIWPERYTEDGRSNRMPGRPRKSSVQA